MSMTGVDPNDPRPSTRRELVFAAGASSGGASEGLVLIYGNKTAAGSETVEKIGVAVGSDADAVARFGRRSEIYGMYRAYVAVDPAATIYMLAVTESGGAPASSTITFTDAATAISTVQISLLGQTVETTVGIGDSITVIAAAVAKAINAADSGGWPVTALANAGVVTVTYSQKGPRGGLCLARLRVRFTIPTTTSVVVAVVTVGTTADDFTLAYAEAATGEYEYQVIPCYSTATVTAADNQIGEGLEYIKAQGMPSVGKSQQMHIGLVGTQAEATAVATSAAANTVRGWFYRAENNDWTPGMLAAHNMAAVRAKQIAYPAANLNGYASTDSSVYQIPAPFLKSDRPTPTEVIADLNNGICPIDFTTRGAPFLTRFITSRSLNAQGDSDYRAREGHVTKVIDFAWNVIKERWATQRQPNIANDPIEGAKPVPLTSTPGQLKSIIWSVIDDLAGPTPLGIYPGPILAPDRIDAMKASVQVTRSTAALVASADLEAVMHLLKSETTINETSPPY